MTEKTDLPNVSMTNTKKELLEAYEEAKEQFETLSKDLLDAEKARKRLEKKWPRLRPMHRQNRIH